MFPTYDQTRALVADRHARFEAEAGQRRLRLLGRRPQTAAPDRRIEQPSTPLDAVGAAPQPISAGRTPDGIDRAA